MNFLLTLLLFFSNIFYDDFSSYSTTPCLADGTTLGPWNVVWNGYGCVNVENEAFYLVPQAATNFGETHSALVTGPSYCGSLNFSVDITTLEQTSLAKNPWEVGWVLWNFTDNAHFYYFIAKPNGWELGKVDPAYPGNQRFLRTGNYPKFPINKLYKITVNQFYNNITIYVNSTKITSFTDTERPYQNGRISIYSEDSRCYYDNIKVLYD